MQHSQVEDLCGLPSRCTSASSRSGSRTCTYRTTTGRSCEDLPSGWRKARHSCSSSQPHVQPATDALLDLHPEAEALDVHLVALGTDEDVRPTESIDHAIVVALVRHRSFSHASMTALAAFAQLVLLWRVSSGHGLLPG